jgi:ABC-type nitrate/sulfonate/bicarbonate transport system substrate-binding protein
MRCKAIAGLFLAAIGFAPAAYAADTISIGTVGRASANLWPVFIGVDKGFYAEEGLKPDIVSVPSSAAMVQQITAGSLDICMSTGLADPLRAVGMGAQIAIVRIEVQAPPYDLVAKATIKSIKDLKGKVVSIGGPKDISRIYIERMLVPNGVNPGEVDMVYAGSTPARASALLAGAIDATLLLPPYNLQAEDKGFHSLGLTNTYVKDLPFSGSVVNIAWANAHKALLQKVLRAHSKSIAWFQDVKNRAEAVRILMAATTLKQDDVEKSYDFFRNGHYFEPTGKVSKSKLSALAKAMESLGDLPGALDVNKAMMAGVTQVTD